MLEALDISPGGEQYLPFAQHLMRRLKVVLMGCRLESGRRHFKTPDGQGTIYLRTRRVRSLQEKIGLQRGFTIPSADPKFAPDDRIDEWYDYIKIEAGVPGGYVFRPFIYLRQTSPSDPLTASSYAGDINFYMPFSKPKVRYEPLLDGESLRPYAQEYKKPGAGITPSFPRYIEDRQLRALGYGYFYGSGIFRHHYTDAQGNKQELLISPLKFGAANMPLHRDDTGAALTSSGYAGATAMWSYSVTSDGRTAIAHGFSPGTGSYKVSIDFAAATQASWQSLSTVFPGTTVSREYIPTVTNNSYTWSGLSYWIVGVDVTAEDGSYSRNTAVERGVPAWSYTVFGHAAMNAAGGVSTTTTKREYSGQSHTTETSTRSIAGSAVPMPAVGDVTIVSRGVVITSGSGNPYASGGEAFNAFRNNSLPWSLYGAIPGSDPSGSALPQKVAVSIGGATKEFPGNDFSFTYNSTIEDTISAPRDYYGGQYGTGGFSSWVGTWTVSISSVATYGGVSVIYCDTLAEVLIYEYIAAVYTRTETYGNTIDYLGPGSDSSGSWSDSLTRTRTIGMLSSARGDVVLFTETLPPTNNSGASTYMPTPSLTAATEMAARPHGTYGNGESGSDVSTSSSGAGTFNYTEGGYAGGVPRLIARDSGSTRTYTYAVAARDPQNWIASVTRVRDWAGNFLNPNTFDIYTSRLPAARVKESFLAELSAHLRSIGNDTVADNLDIGNLDPYEIKLHSRGQFADGGTLRNDNVASFIQGPLLAL